MTGRAVFSDKRKKMLANGPLHHLGELLERMESQYGSEISVIEKQGENKLFYTAEKLCGDVRALGTALLDRGFENAPIAILSENSYRWIVGFLAIVCSGNVAVPLDRELTDSELLLLAQKSDIRALFYTDTFASAVRCFKENGPAPCDFFSLCDANEPREGWESLQMRGKELLNRGDRRMADVPLSAAHTAAVVFTSGTTGANKGAVLTHGNLVSNINAVAEHVPVEDSTISVLPMNHVYELNCNILPMLYINTVICINDRMRNLMHNLRFFSPGMAVVVPMFLESFYDNIRQKLRKDGQDQKTEQLIALSNRLLDGGIDMRRVLFKRIHAYFGNNLSLLICGAAPVNEKYVTGLTELGFDVYVGYGLTEASPIAALNTQTRRHPHSVGMPFYNTQVHIHAPDPDGEGEIWLRGENITPGYYKDPVATAESFTDGWFKTGDFGRLDAKGRLYVTGRKKNLIVLDNGKNVHPEEIESLICAQLPYVREAVVMETEKEVFGKLQRIIAAVLYVDPLDFPEQSVQETEAMAKADMMQVNAKLPGYKAVNHVFIATGGFQKTSTNKILRSKVIEQYTDAADAGRGGQQNA